MSSRLEPEPPARRDFLGLAGIGAAALAIFGSLIGMARLPKPRVTPEASSLVRVGKPDEFPEGTRTSFPQHKVLVMATAKGVAAMSLLCTHLGCIVTESEQGFSCPCHGSKFSDDGTNISGPAPRPLRWLSVSQAADGSLVVDASSDVEPGNYFKPYSA